jgi:hypothetical protein
MRSPPPSSPSFLGVLLSPLLPSYTHLPSFLPKVYFADSPYKAIQYCGNDESGDGKIAVMLICEVAMGLHGRIKIDDKTYSGIAEELKRYNEHSLWAQGTNYLQDRVQM